MKPENCALGVYRKSAAALLIKLLDAVCIPAHGSVSCNIAAKGFTAFICSDEILTAGISGVQTHGSGFKRD